MQWRMQRERTALFGCNIVLNRSIHLLELERNYFRCRANVIREILRRNATRFSRSFLCILKLFIFFFCCRSLEIVASLAVLANRSFFNVLPTIIIYRACLKRIKASSRYFAKNISKKKISTIYPLQLFPSREVVLT